MTAIVCHGARYGAAGLFRLPLRVHPEDDEPILSLLVRLAEENRFPKVCSFTRLIGLPTAGIHKVADCLLDLAALAAASGLTVNRLQFMQYARVSPSHVAWLGKPIHRSLVHSKHRRWCPACLEEVPYHRAAWDLLPIGACHRHKLVLAWLCPGCGNEVGWPGKMVECRCGGDLRRSPHRPVTESAAGAARDLLEWLWVDAERGAEVTVLATTLGWFSNQGRCEPPYKRTLRQCLDSRAQDLEIGWAALQDWPDGFNEYLNRHFPPDRAQWPFVRWLGRRYQGPLKAEMSAAVTAHSLAAGRREHRAKEFCGPLHADHPQ